MRKEIKKRLTLAEITRMDCHEILECMGFSLVRDVAEEDLRNDVESFPVSFEFSMKVGHHLGFWDWRLNMVILLNNLREEYGLSDRLDWKMCRFIINNDNRRDLTTNVCRCSHSYIDKTDNTIIVGYNPDALTDGSDRILDYYHLSLGDAREHLSIITGLREDVVDDFCKYHLVDEILNMKDYFNNISREPMSCWYTTFMDSINNHLDKDFYKITSLRANGELVTLSISDYILFLTVIKNVYRFRDDKLVKSYLNSSYCSEKSVRAEGEETLRKFCDAFSYAEECPSVCPEECLFNLDGYFKNEYVNDVVADFDGERHIDGTEELSHRDCHDDEQSLKDLIRSALKNGKMTVNINIENNHK